MTALASAWARAPGTRVTAELLREQVAELDRLAARERGLTGTGQIENADRSARR